MYKASQFVVLSEPVCGSIAAFSTLTQNLVIFDEAEADDFRNGVFADEEGLQKLGFITEIERNESATAEQLRKTLIARRGDGLSVTVVPSVGCNFACSYCYNGIHAYKPGNTEASFRQALAYAKANLLPNSTLNVTWYGGEPLLFQKQIPDWARQFIELAEERNCAYFSDILSNGSTISKGTSDLLLAAGITRIQVSVDWPADGSGRKLKFISGEETLKRVLRNVNFLSPAIKVTLRVNTPPGFLDTFDQLLELVRTLVKRKLGIYCHRLYESNDASLNDSESSQLRYDGAKGYATDYLAAKKLIRSFGYHQEYFPETIPIGQCIAQSSGDVIVNHEGSMRKCPREIEGEGAIVKSDGTKNAQAIFYQEMPPADDLDCRRCSYLPVCHGGCVKEYFHSPEEKLNRCSLWKFTLREELTNYLIDHQSGRKEHAQSKSYDRSRP